MVPFAPFDYFVKRKLFVHNMGHAITAYLGDLLGIKYIYEAIDNDDVYIIVKGAMEESARALSKKYDVEMPIIEKAYDVIFNELSPKDAVLSLMLRDKKDEIVW